MKATATKKKRVKTPTGDHLTPEQIEELKELSLQGMRPPEVAAHFNIAVSTVFYQKKKLTNRGVVFPPIRGRVVKPTNNNNQRDKSTKPTASSGQPNPKNTLKKSTQHGNSRNTTGVNNKTTLKIIIDGTPIQVRAGTSVQVQGAKSFKMGEHGNLEIVF